MRKLVCSVAALALLAGCDGFDGPSKEAIGDGTGTVELAEFPERPLWGDTHLHTDNSFDAFGFGARLGPEDALRFASGEEVTSTTGIAAKLSRPLDFLVIADHAELLGGIRRLYDAPRVMIRDETMRKWYDMMHESPQGSQRAMSEIIAAAAANTLPAGMNNPEANAEAIAGVWTAHLDTLDRFNKPGAFTALAGYEYSLVPGGNNLHRVVVFRDGSEKTKQTIPFGWDGTDEANVSQLWDYMEGYEKATGGSVLAIPHNSNMSDGTMFELTKHDGGPMTAEYARRRAQHEPIVEATQIKGDSESHPFLSPNDEFASFGDVGWELGNLTDPSSKESGMFAGEYLREALKRGLTIEQQTGVNPYQFGMIGSTDSHTALATADEDNFFGKHTGNEPRGDRGNEAQNLGTRKGRFAWNYLAGGYAAVWARANTRAEIFDAMERREVYATTGPRMVVRLFAGFDFAENAFDGDWVRDGYTNGVPMGGSLVDEGKAPRFVVSALKDPEGANLDRVQIVKGWVDASGNTRERVYDIAWSDPANRLMSGGKLPAVGDTVDREKATYENSIGAPELNTVWTDPDYREGQNAFYYVRVLEIPTPRWTLFDAVRFGVELSAESAASSVSQERAYSSPVWLSSPKTGV